MVATPDGHTAVTNSTYRLCAFFQRLRRFWQGLYIAILQLNNISPVLGQESPAVAGKLRDATVNLD